MLLRFIGSLQHSAEAQAAYAVGYAELFSLITWTSVGLMGAAAAVAGQNLGAGQPERSCTRRLHRRPHRRVVAASVGALFLLIPEQLLAIFGLTTGSSSDLGTQLLRYLSVSGFFITVALTYTGGLQGTGDTRGPLYITLVSQVVMPIGICAALQRLGRLEASGVWTAILLGHFTRCFLTVGGSGRRNGGQSWWSSSSVGVAGTYAEFAAGCPPTCANPASPADRVRHAGTVPGRCKPRHAARRPAGVQFARPNPDSLKNRRAYEVDEPGTGAASRTCARSSGGMADAHGRPRRSAACWSSSSSAGLTGVDFPPAGSGGGAGAPPSANAGPGELSRHTPEEEAAVDMVDAVMATPGDVAGTSSAAGIGPTTAVMFRDAYPSGCGIGQSATGPFYCPADQQVYLDLGFFGELRAVSARPGDFAQAYVIAHEVGHHVQRITGTEAQVRQRSSRRVPISRTRCRWRWSCRRTAMRASGVTGREPRRQGKVSSNRGTSRTGLKAAAAIGDDRIQRMRPDAWRPIGSPTVRRSSA